MTEQRRDPPDLAAVKARLASTHALRAHGKVLGVTGLRLKFSLPGARVGDLVRVKRRGAPLSCEVVGFDRGEAIAMAYGDLTGVGPDDEVESTGGGLSVRVSAALLGRVVDGLGRPIDGGADVPGVLRSVEGAPVAPLARRPIARPLATGVRAIDALMTLGEGQRVGLFAGAGVGKSTLLGAIARGTAADVVVVALVGERGREVAEFLEHALGPLGRARSIVVIATSDAPALERLRAAEVATTYAEHFRDEGLRVMLLFDSVTRYARAQRELGLAAGEPGTRRGYPPSVFARLPRLLERAGQGTRGSITGIYSVLVEGGDLDEPIADEVRGILDGHVVLDRGLAARARYPAIDPVASLSRVMDRIVSADHARAAQRLRALVARYEEKRDMVALGAYKKGGDPALDEALARMPAIEAFLAQLPAERAGFDESLERLERLAVPRSVDSC